MNRHPRQLECLSLTVPEEALEAYEAALWCACDTVGFFRDHATATWRLEGVRTAGARENELTGATSSPNQGGPILALDVRETPARLPAAGP